MGAVMLAPAAAESIVTGADELKVCAIDHWLLEAGAT
jgi:hypothetical protein